MCDERPALLASPPPRQFCCAGKRPRSSQGGERMILPLSVLVPTVAALGVVLLGIWYSLYLVVFRPKFRRNREGLVLITGGASVILQHTG